jgi:hypothetical protein
VVAVESSGKRTTGTVWLPPFTPSTNLAASAVALDVDLR